jgi:hypothetical protein
MRRSPLRVRTLMLIVVLAGVSTLLAREWRSHATRHDALAEEMGQERAVCFRKALGEVWRAIAIEYREFREPPYYRVYALGKGTNGADVCRAYDRPYTAQGLADRKKLARERALKAMADASESLAEAAKAGRQHDRHLSLGNRILNFLRTGVD